MLAGSAACVHALLPYGVPLDAIDPDVWLAASCLVRARDKKRCAMKKGFTLIFEDEELIELCRILMDRDTEGALTFLQAHFKGKVRELLEGG
jgi:hypothetical protein